MHRLCVEKKQELYLYQKPHAAAVTFLFLKFIVSCWNMEPQEAAAQCVAVIKMSGCFRKPLIAVSPCHLMETFAQRGIS